MPQQMAFRAEDEELPGTADRAVLVEAEGGNVDIAVCANRQTFRTCGTIGQNGEDLRGSPIRFILALHGRNNHQKRKKYKDHKSSIHKNLFEDFHWRVLLRTSSPQSGARCDFGILDQFCWEHLAFSDERGNGRIAVN